MRPHVQTTADRPGEMSPAKPGGGHGDAVTNLRHEYKFLFRRRHLDLLQAVLATNARPIRFGQAYESRVSSIYFDSDSLAGCRESLAGVSPRTKVRLRWYDHDWPDHTCWLETKRKKGTFVTKHRSPVELGPQLDSLGYGDLVERLKAAASIGERGWLETRSMPTVLVSYRRRHYRDPDSTVRLTLDYDVTGADQVGRQGPSRRSSVPVRDLVIVEVKASPQDVGDVQRLLYPLKPRLARLSKYVQCCTRMGWPNLTPIDA